MKFRNIKYMLCMIFFAVPITGAQAQWYKSLSLGTGYDSNAFRTYAARADYVTQLSAYLARDFRSAHWQGRVFYDGRVNLFSNFSERNFLYQRAGAALTYRFSGNRHMIFFGANGLHRANREVYDYYDLREGSMYANIRLRLLATSFAQFGYRLRGRWYANLADFDYREDFFFIRLTHGLPTRTTVVFEADLGQKHYLREITQVVENSGMSYDGEYGWHQGGMGHMQGPGQRTNPTAAVQRLSPPDVQQWVISLRLAQALTPKTGAYLELAQRRIAESSIRYLAGQVAGYTSEDELFDDPYGYESEDIAMGITQLLPWQLTLQLDAAVIWKSYVERPALDLTGDPILSGDLRADRRRAVWLLLAKEFPIGASSRSMQLQVRYNFIDNRSNDLYYVYRVGNFSLGIELAF